MGFSYGYNESISQIKKRQEVGRGLRLCIQQDGRRYRDPKETPEGKEINRLTIVPNESYHAFVLSYQTELREELGEHAEVHEIQDENRMPSKIKRIESRAKSSDFARLWNRIGSETRCKVYFREDSLVEQGIKALSEIVIAENELSISLHSWSKIKNDIIEDTHEGSTHVDTKGQHASLDLVEELSRSTLLARATVIEILTGLPEEQLFMLAQNPMKFIAEAMKSLRGIITKEMVRLVSYERTGKTLSMTDLFSDEEETRRDITPTLRRGLYDHIIHDSPIEKDMAITFDGHSTVRLFLKLPKSYKIPTPIGGYTPDFALVMEKHDLNDSESKTKYYFVIETKGTDDLTKLRDDERLKIQFAIKHFEALGMEGYLAPVNSTQTFDDKARKAISKTFFDH